MIIPRNQDGFTAVELLITLLVASMFLFAGYQLYNQVTRDGNDANKLAKSSNIGYEKLREKAISTSSAYPNGCNFTGANQDVTVENNVTYTATASCPFSTTNPLDVFLIEVRAYEKNPSGGSGYGPLIMELATYVN